MTEAASSPAKPGKNAFLFVVVAVILNMLSFGIIMPVMPALLLDITGLAAEQSVSYGGWLSMTFAIANFFMMPILGGLSDRYGRRPVLLASIAMLGIDLLIMGLAPTLAVLFIGRFLGGMFSATYSVANAYIADVTEPEDRGRAFGIMGAAFGIGFILGPVFGGLLGEINPRLPFFVAAGIAGLNFLYGWFILPESLREEDRRDFDIVRANPFGAMVHFSKVPRVAWFIIAIGLYQIAHAVYPSTWNFHGEIRYDWSEFEIGLSLAFVGVGSALGQGLLTGYLIKRMGPMRAALFGFSSNAIALFLFSLAGAPWMAYAIIAVSSVGGVAMPAINTITSTLTPRNEQGELQGAQASMMAFTLIFSPVLMTQTLKYFANLPESDPLHTGGAAFFLAGLITTLSLVPLFVGIGINRRAIARAAAAETTAAE
ncbi:MAG: TCR/Tet family MFS transporter [Hyphomonadaceae bacterium]|nr:TCR/Tet family MFS transporter [Hyphomonadaceae bacterium]